MAFLLQRGAKPNQARTDNNGAPLYVAAGRNLLNVAKLLLQCGADPNHTCGAENFTPLYIASQEGFVEMVELLIQSGANVRLVLLIDILTICFGFFLGQSNL